jgi:hypothetical protein
MVGSKCIIIDTCCGHCFGSAFDWRLDPDPEGLKRYKME